MSTLLTCISGENDSPAVIIPFLPPIIISHRQLPSHVLSFQEKLAAIGIAPKDAVAIACPNTIEFAIAFLATSFQRAICAPLNPAYKQDEFEFYLEDLEAAIILVPKGAIAENGEAIRAAKKCNTAIAEVYWNGQEVSIEVGGQENSNGIKKVGIERPRDHDVALILHTSGTTGRPKAVGPSKRRRRIMKLDLLQVPLTHENLCQTIRNIQATYDLTAADRTLLIMPLFHVHGLLAGFLSPLASGGSAIVPPRFSASEFWREFIAHGATWYTAVPTIHQILLKSTLPSPMPMIRFVRSCSSPLAPTVHKQLEMIFAAPVLEAYAMTEAAHQMTSNPLPPAVRKPGSVGLPQGLEVRIVDDDCDYLPQGQIGEVCVSGPNVTAGYLGEGIKSPFTKTGYLRTGDQGYVDQDGYLFLTGRIKELINKGGEKISPIEIDNLFTQNASVAEAVSFAIDDELYGQNVAVAIALKEGSATSSEELLAWFAQKVAQFKVPKKVLHLFLFRLKYQLNVLPRYSLRPTYQKPPLAKFNAALLQRL